jgi:predicted XRE-type DNA-binding protein
MTSKIDTKIRHVTKPGANLFAELGFSPVDARRHQAEARERIDHVLTLKKQLMEEIEGWIKESRLKQDEAAHILHVTRPRVSDVVNKKTSKFTLDALVTMLSSAGKPVRIVTGALTLSSKAAEELVARKVTIRRGISSEKERVLPRAGSSLRAATRPAGKAPSAKAAKTTKTTKTA